MALLEDEAVAHGPLEALFTVNEEDGFTGADAVQPGVLRGSLLINVDSEEEGTFTIGSAGGADVDVTGSYAEESTPAGIDRHAPPDHGPAGRSFGHRHQQRPRQRDQAPGPTALERAERARRARGLDRGWEAVQRHPAGGHGGGGRPRDAM